jgi:Tfp pilus assembly protein PilV
MRVSNLAGRSAGFTLVELNVAIMVLVVGLLGLAAATSVVAAQRRTAATYTHIWARTQEEMERLLAAGPAGLAPGEVHEGPLRINWQARDADPVELLLVTRVEEMGRVRSDTIATLVAVPDRRFDSAARR